MTAFRWLAEFLLPGLPIARPLTLGGIHVLPVPRGENERSHSNGHLTFEPDTHLRDAEARAHAQSQLELVALAATATGGSVGEPVVTSVRLDNQADLEASGVPIPLDACFTLKWKVLAPDIDETAVIKGYRVALEFGPQEAPFWRRAARWLWKANSEAHPYDRFLALWIAFNVLYGPKRIDSEPNAIRNYLAETIPSEQVARSLLAGVIEEDLRLLGGSGLSLRRDKSWPVADELQVALGTPETTPSPRQVLTLSCLVVYAVRCAVVHEGGFDIPREKEVGLVWASGRVLKAVLMHAFKSRLGV